MKSFPTIAVAYALCFFCLGQESGIYSRTATSVWAPRSAFTILSPDNKKTLSVKPNDDPKQQDDGVVAVRAFGREHRTKIGSWVNSEAAWAPDSKAFFVTYSDSGNIGTYHVKIFYVEPERLRVVEPFPNGRVLFARRVSIPNSQT